MIPSSTTRARRLTSSVNVGDRDDRCDREAPVTVRYMTLDDPAATVEDDEDFADFEAKTGEHITPSILRWISQKRALHG
jgi:hypothetical protein